MYMYFFLTSAIISHVALLLSTEFSRLPVSSKIISTALCSIFLCIQTSYSTFILIDFLSFHQKPKTKSVF